LKSNPHFAKPFSPFFTKTVLQSTKISFIINPLQANRFYAKKKISLDIFKISFKRNAMCKPSYEIIFTSHALFRAKSRGIHAGLLHETVQTGRFEWFGKNRVKIIKEYDRCSVSQK